jgi:hypothetical protein
MNTHKIDFTILKICNLASIIYIVFGLVGFAVLAGFWPPPAQHLSADEIGLFFREHSLSIRAGMVAMAFAGPFYFVWSATLSKIIQRIEGPMGTLSTIELLGGLLTALVTFTPATIWLTAALRPETRTFQEVQLLYDFGWIFFDLTFVCSALQAVALGVAVHIDKRERPLFPSWSGWLCYAVAASYFPLVLVPFFFDGPFSWHGLICFWVVFVMFFIMIIVMTPLAFSALNRLEAEQIA